MLHEHAALAERSGIQQNRQALSRRELPLRVLVLDPLGSPAQQRLLLNVQYLLQSWVMAGSGVLLHLRSGSSAAIGAGGLHIKALNFGMRKPGSGPSAQCTSCLADAMRHATPGRGCQSLSSQLISYINPDMSAYAAGSARCAGLLCCTILYAVTLDRGHSPWSCHRRG